MASLKNKERLSELEGILADQDSFIISTYSGLSVEAMTALRRKVRAKSGRLKVVKNNLFRLVLTGSDQHKGKVQDLEESLHGAIAVTFAKENDFPAVSKVLSDAAKEQPLVVIKQGFFSGESLNAGQVKQMANLPSREELLAIIARGMNAPAQKIATGINQIIGSLARGIKAVGEKNG